MSLFTPRINSHSHNLSLSLRPLSLNHHTQSRKNGSKSRSTMGHTSPRLGHNPRIVRIRRGGGGEGGAVALHHRLCDLPTEPKPRKVHLPHEHLPKDDACNGGREKWSVENTKCHFTISSLSSPLSLLSLFSYHMSTRQQARYKPPPQ